MVYIVTRQKPQAIQYSFEDLLFNRIPMNAFATPEGSSGTITHKIETVSNEIKSKVDITGLINLLETFNKEHNALFQVPRESLYTTFYIPKKTGGLRKIDKPNQELMAALRRLKEILEKYCGILHHTAAFAYVKDRSIVDAIMKHQANNSNWFLKTDFSNFFPSITLEFTMKMFSMIFPFSEIVKVPNGKTQLTIALSLAFLNGGLPQGTPLSPTLTNIIMIPIDHTLFNDLAKRKYVYTRYADDMIISCEQYFDYKKIVSHIKGVLKQFGTPFAINDEKTRYGSKKGSNWNLGLMLNKDNNITVGYMRKKQFKAAMNNFILDTLHNKPWPIADIQTLQGTVSYYKMVEENYFNDIIHKMNTKYQVDFEQMMKNQLML